MRNTVLAAAIFTFSIALFTCATSSAVMSGMSEVMQEPVFIQILGGYNHTTALRSDGTVWEWGGDSIDSPLSPVQVQNLNNIVSISDRAAVSADGILWTWGPMAVVSLEKFEGFADIVMVQHQNGFTIALRKDGTVWGWGRNDSGQLGDGTNIDSPDPVQAIGLSDIVAISASFGGNNPSVNEWGTHCLALTKDGKVYSWGSNDAGQLGDGSTIESYIPKLVPGLGHIVAIAACGGYAGRGSSVALDSVGTVWAWGQNDAGQLADGTNIDRSVPLPISGLSEITGISGGGWDHYLALGADGTVWAWGAYGREAALGNGISDSKNFPVQVKKINNIVTIGTGYNFSFAIDKTGTTWAWGRNEGGQLGDLTHTERYLAVEVK